MLHPDDPNKHQETCDKTGLTMPIAEYGNLNVVRMQGISVHRRLFLPRKAMPSCRGPTSLAIGVASSYSRKALLLVALPPKEKGAMWTIEDVEVVNMKFHSYVLTFAQDRITSCTC